MGLFDKLKEINEQNKETDVSKMKFERFTGLVGCLPQAFANKSLPVCPMCGKETPWLLHVATKIVKMFPIAKQDHTYHLKCEECGLVMHTTVHEVGENMPHEVRNPSPRNNITMMTFDVLGDRAENFELAGKEMSIWEINQMAENKK